MYWKKWKVLIASVLALSIIRISANPIFAQDSTPSSDSAVHELTDQATGVTVSAKENAVLPAGAKLSVSAVMDISPASLGINPGNGENEAASYQISLGDQIVLSAPVTVSIPLPEGFTEAAAVYDLGQNTPVKLQSAAAAGKVSFDTSELGTFALIDTKKSESSLAAAKESSSQPVILVGSEDDVKVSAAVSWDDSEDQDQLRPKTVTLTLYADGQPYAGEDASVTLPDQSGSWKAEWTVPKASASSAAVQYSVRQDTLPQYYQTVTSGNAADGFTFTNSLSTADTIMHVIFTDSNDFSNIYHNRPTGGSIIATGGGLSVTIPLTAADKDSTATAGQEKYSRTIHLPKVDADGKTIGWNYQLGSDVPGCYDHLGRSDATEDGIAAVSLYPTISQTYAYVYRNWDDQNNQSGQRPSSVGITILADGQPAATRTWPDAWKTSATDSDDAMRYYSLPKRDAAGNIISYSVVQSALPAYYTASYETPELSTYDTKLTINNKLQQTSYTAKVQWDDNSNAKNKRPASVDLTLLANGETYQGTNPVVEVSDTNSWTYNWASLPAVDENGKAIVYTVKESPLPIHTTAYDFSDAKNGVVTNTLQDDWNYSIDLKWDTPVLAEKYDRTTVTTSSSTVTLKYSLTITTNSAIYEPGQLEIRLPYALWKNRDGTANLPTDIGVPKAPDQNPANSFNYWIDDKGTPDDASDDEIVYTNWKQLPAGTNETLTAIYVVDPLNTIDLSKAVLTAKGSGTSTLQQSPESEQSATITYQMDTGLNINSLVKEEEKLLYDWSDQYGKKPADFDTAKYNYVVYHIALKGYTDQPFDLKFQDVPSDNGKIVSIRNAGLSYQADDYYDYDLTDGTWSNKKTFVPTKNHCGLGSEVSSLGDEYFYVTVAYPRVDESGKILPPGGEGQNAGKYSNQVHVTATAKDVHPGDKQAGDLNDIATADSTASAEWHDYVFHWDGDIYETSKSLYQAPSAGASMLKYGNDFWIGTSLQFRVNGYELGNYTMDMYDSNLYWNTTGTANYADYVPMTADDYEFGLLNNDENSRFQLSISLSDIDRTNGNYTTNVSIPTDPFIVYAQKGQAGEWEEIARLTMTKASDSFYLPASEFNGKGYTGLRITAPKGLKAAAQISFYPYIHIKSSSAQLKKWLAAGSAENIYFLNIASYKLFQQQKDGSYAWTNQAAKGQSEQATGVGLDQQDLANVGAYVEHKSGTIGVGSATFRDSVDKETVSVTNDTVHSKVDAVFCLTAGEGTYSDVFPEDVYQAMSFDTGVFYDLLPAGYVYNSKAGITVKGAGTGSNSVDAEVTSVQTTENYHGTGREMVIFHVKSLAAAGQNVRYGLSTVENSSWSGSSYAKMTGYSLEFSASISWDALAYHRQGTNLMAFQEGQDRQLWGKPDYWSGPFGDEGKPNSLFSSVTGSDGKPAFYDVNGDQNTAKLDTLYGTSSINPNIAESVETQISKQVKGISGIYQKNDVAALGGTYSYQIGVTTSDNGTSKKMVIYDILENAANTAGNTGETGWKGVFAGLSTAVPEGQGIQPTIYYSTVDDLDYNELDADQHSDRMDITNTAVWTTVKPQNDADIKAVAIDLSKAKDGSDYVFTSKAQTSVEIFMTAPADMPAQPAVLAYNRPAYSNFFTAAGNVDGSEEHNIGSRVTVSLAKPQEFSFFKLGETISNDGTSTGTKPLAGVQFKLYRCSSTAEGHVHTGTPGTASSCWGTAPVQVVSSQEDGKVTFSGLDSGTYAIVESRTRAGYKLLSGWWIITVDAENGTVSEPDSSNSSTMPMTKQTDGTYAITNTRMRVSYNVEKSWQDGYEGSVFHPASVTIHLLQNGILLKDIVLSSSNRWATSVTNLPDRDDNGSYYTYTIVEDPVEGYEVKYQRDGYDLTAKNSRSWGAFSVTKLLSSWTNDVDQQFQFSISLTDADGKPLTGTFKLRDTDKNGNTTISDFTTDEAGKEKIKLKNKETAVIYMLPAGSGYEVTEDSASGYSTELNRYSKPSGKVDTVTVPSVIYTNTYRSEGEWTPSAVKTVNGKEPTDNQTFTFDLYRKGTSDYYQIDSTENKGSLIQFQPIKRAAMTVNWTDSEQYQIRESGTDANGYVLDRTVYDITVNWKDNGDGTLTAVPQITKGSTTVDQAVFDNQYHVVPVTLSLTAKKTVDGSTPSSDQKFSFTMKGSNGVAQTKENTGGTITFDPLTYTLDDAGKTFTYTVTEDADASGMYHTDPSVYQISDQVTDNGKGTLSVSRSITKDGAACETIVFANESLTSITVSKIWDDSGNRYGRRPASISFQLQKTAGGQTADVTGKSVTMTAANADSADAGKWQYTFADLPKYENGKAITYSVREASADANYTAAADGLSITNTLRTYDCQILKADSSGRNAVQDALLSISDESGRIYDTWHSGSEAHSIRLPAGSYLLSELSAPSGYEIASPIKFTIDASGRMLSDSLTDGVLVMKDSKTPTTPTPTPTPETPVTPNAFVVPNTADQSK